MSDYIPDYTDLFNEYEARREDKIEKFPKCDCCGERIVTKKFFNIEGTYICKVCIEDYEVETEDYIKD